MTDKSLEDLYALCQRWSERQRPVVLPDRIPVERLPRSKYDGDNPYNGFTGAQRRRTEQVQQVLRRRSIIPKPTECAMCGKTERIGFHGEDYFDPFSLITVCFPCHMAIHARFKSPQKWYERLELFASSTLISEFASLPMEEPDFAAWLMHNTSGPHDAVKRVWPNGEMLDYQPRVSCASPKLQRFERALKAMPPSDTEWKLLWCLAENPGATSAELTEKMGWAGNAAWHMKTGSYCRRLELYLGEAPSAGGRKDAHGNPAKFYIGLIAEFNSETRGFTMLPNMVEALKRSFQVS